MVGMVGLRIPAGSDISERFLLRVRVAVSERFLLTADPAGLGFASVSTGSTGRPSTESLSEELPRNSKGEPSWLVGKELGEDSLASV
jgi:hypothetical protein